jgi:hypothetical protein
VHAPVNSNEAAAKHLHCRVIQAEQMTLAAEPKETTSKYLWAAPRSHEVTHSGLYAFDSVVREVVVCVT